MCEIQKEKTVTCQLSFIPIGKVEYTKDIDEILKIIENSKLYYEIGNISTTIKGNSTIVFNILKDITNYCSNYNINFTMTTIISNT